MPKSFRDTQGRTWSPRITMKTVLQIERDLGINFFDETAKGTLQGTLSKSAATVFGVLFLSVKDQAKERKVTIDDLADAFDGETLKIAGESLRDAWVEFWPKAKVEDEGGGPDGRPPLSGPGTSSIESPPAPK